MVTDTQPGQDQVVFKVNSVCPYLTLPYLTLTIPYQLYASHAHWNPQYVILEHRISIQTIELIYFAQASNSSSFHISFITYGALMFSF